MDNSLVLKEQMYSGLLTFYRAEHLDGSFLDALNVIYTISFPPGERVEFSKLISDIHSKRHEIYLVQNEQSKLIGFAILALLLSSKVWFGEYIAIAPDYRNQGIGSELIKFITKDLKERTNAAGLIFEVETEDEGDDEEKDLRQRRIAFYKRLGANIINCVQDYQMPNLAGEGTLRMRLMWIPLSSGIEKPGGAFLRACIKDIFRKIYDRLPNDAVLHHNLKRLTC